MPECQCRAARPVPDSAGRSASAEVAPPWRRVAALQERPDAVGAGRYGTASAQPPNVVVHAPLTQWSAQSASLLQARARHVLPEQVKLPEQSLSPLHAFAAQRCVAPHTMLGPQSAFDAHPFVQWGPGCAPPRWQLQGRSQMRPTPASAQSVSIWQSLVKLSSHLPSQKGGSALEAQKSPLAQSVPLRQSPGGRPPPLPPPPLWEPPAPEPEAAPADETLVPQARVRRDKRSRGAKHFICVA
jgi:hypothetical protein